MNRTLTNVLFGGIGTTAQSDYKIEGTITKTSVDETVDALSNADSVILVWFASILTTRISLTSACSGCWVRDGCGQGSIRYLRNRESAASQRHHCPICYSSCSWKVSLLCVT